MTFIRVVFILGIVISFLGCNQGDDKKYVARVGDKYLLQDDLSSALATMPAGLDSAETSKQFIERWVTNELLAQEAEREGLKNKPEVKELLEENARSVLINALIESLDKQELPEPTVPEIESYFLQNRDQLALREEYVRVRYLKTQDRTSANLAHRALSRAMQKPQETDSLWQNIVKQYASDVEGSLTLSSNYIPEGRLLNSSEPVWQQIKNMNKGDLANVIVLNDDYHVLQLVDRVPKGTPPRIAWIQNEIREILRIRARKQAYYTFVQQLKNEATARKGLEIREPKSKQKPIVEPDSSNSQTKTEDTAANE